MTIPPSPICQPDHQSTGNPAFLFLNPSKKHLASRDPVVRMTVSLVWGRTSLEMFLFPVPCTRSPTRWAVLLERAWISFALTKMDWAITYSEAQFRRLQHTFQSMAEPRS